MRSSQWKLCKLHKSVLERWSQVNQVRRKKGDLIKLRNQDVQKKAKKAYESIVPDGCQLNVFCVSNQEYRKLKYEDQTGCIKASQTGIPQLREFALAIAAPPIEKHFSRRVKTSMPSFIETVHLWCTKKSIENAAEILAIVVKPQQVCQFFC